MVITARGLNNYGSKSGSHYSVSVMNSELKRVTNVDLQEWAQALPKIDLHRHLEGSLRLSTLVEIAREYQVDLPSQNTSQLRPYVQVTTEDAQDFHSFLGKFSHLRRFYLSQDIIQRVAREAVMDAAADNIRYFELRFNPIAFSRVRGFALRDVIEWIMAAVDQAQQEAGIRACLIIQIGRDESVETANQLVDQAIAHCGPLVRGIDLAGDETRYLADRFIRPFWWARSAGLQITVHAGEAAGADSVRAAVEHLGAQRLGHGVRAVEDSNVVQLLKARKIALEVCPTSNVQTGVIRTYKQHPLLDLFSLGLRVTLNTDDPSISNTTLSQEIVAAVRDIGLSRRMIYRTLRHAVEAAFIPEAERASLREDIRTRLASYPEAQEEFA